ncbi:MAG: hypothetical protein AVDCRST_MAG30-4079, partial [uncultured Solirubrobacteraceae bacterium]
GVPRTARVHRLLPRRDRGLRLEPGGRRVALAPARPRRVRGLPGAALARVLPRAARRLSRRDDPVAAHLGRLRRGLRLQQRRPRARRRRHQALPDQDVDPALELPGGGRELLRRGRLRPGDGRLHPHLRVLAGRLPQAARLRLARRLRPLLPRVAPALHALPAHRARDRRARRLRGALRAGAGVLGAGAPGPDHPGRPPALLPRGLPRPARGMGLPLHRVLVPARGVPGRRLGAQRAARARRQRGRRDRAVHAGRGGRPAGAARQGVRGDGGGGHGGGLLRRPADRDRDVLARDGLRGARARLPLPLLQGGHRGGPRRPRGGRRDEGGRNRGL